MSMGFQTLKQTCRRRRPGRQSQNGEACRRESEALCEHVLLLWVTLDGWIDGWMVSLVADYWMKRIIGNGQKVLTRALVDVPDIWLRMER